MVLLSRLSTYLVPFIYFLVALSWLMHSNWVYYGSAFVIILLAISIFSITRQAGDMKVFLYEMIYPLLTQIIGLSFLVFLPKNWLFVIMIIFFAIMLYLILNEAFDRHHPFLGKTFDFNTNLQMVLIVALVFFMSVIGYNFVLYLNWALWFVSLVMIILIALLLLRLQGYKHKMDYMFVDIAVIILTMEVFYILYYLPVDLYLKGLIVAANLFILFKYIINKQFHKITKQYEFKEKT